MQGSAAQHAGLGLGLQSEQAGARGQGSAAQGWGWGCSSSRCGHGGARQGRRSAGRALLPAVLVRRGGRGCLAGEHRCCLVHLLAVQGRHSTPSVQPALLPATASSAATHTYRAVAFVRAQVRGWRGFAKAEWWYILLSLTSKQVRCARLRAGLLRAAGTIVTCRAMVPAVVDARPASRRVAHAMIRPKECRRQACCVEQACVFRCMGAVVGWSKEA